MSETAVIENAGRVIAIGDIHGCIDELNQLLFRLEPGAGDTIVFLGDYCDRGPDSAAVITRILELQMIPDLNVHCVLGNHDLMMMQWFNYSINPETDAQMRSEQEQLWFMNGGLNTLNSYMVDGEISIPNAHIEFLQALPYYLETTIGDERFIFVHAGFQADRTIGEQIAALDTPARDTVQDHMLWGRDFNRMWFDRNRRVAAWEPDTTVVVGHNIVSEPENYGNLIRIDTGGFIQKKYGFHPRNEPGRITAVELPNRRFTFTT